MEQITRDQAVRAEVDLTKRVIPVPAVNVTGRVVARGLCHATSSSPGARNGPSAASSPRSSSSPYRRQGASSKNDANDANDAAGISQKGK